MKLSSSTTSRSFSHVVTPWLLLGLSLAAGSTAGAGLEATQAEPTTDVARKDVFFLIDVTGSMVGQPPGSGNKDILGRILRRVVEHIDFHCRQGDRLYVATFQDKLHDLDGPGAAYQIIKSFEMRRDLDPATAYVLSLERGARTDPHAVPMTGIYDSVGDMFQIMRRAAKEAEGRGRIDNYSQRLVLFTDGEENVRPLKIRDILEQYQILREESNMGDRVFWTTLVYGKRPDAVIPPGPGRDSLSADPDQPIRTTVQVLPGDVDLGNILGRKESAVALRLDPGDLRLSRLSAAVEAVSGDLPDETIRVRPSMPIANGEAQLVFEFANADTVADRVRRAGGEIAFSGAVALRPEDERYEISPRRVRFAGRYAGTRDVTLSLAFRNDALFRGREDGGLARFRPEGQRVKLLDARFSTLAEKDVLKLSLRRTGGLDPGVVVALSVAADGATADSIEVDGRADSASLVLPPIACMMNTRILYELKVVAPEGLSMRVQTADGEQVPLTADGRSAVVSLPILARDYPECRKPFCPSVACTVTWLLAVIALACAGVFGWFAISRPSRAARLEGQGLVSHRLRHMQGFFSSWVQVGGSSGLRHSELPAPAFRIRSTRFGGTRIVPLIDGVEVDGKPSAKGAEIRVRPTGTIRVRPGEDQPEVEIQLYS